MHTKKIKKLEDADLIAIGRRVIEMEADGVRGLLEHLNENFVRAVNLIYDCSGRLIITGLGKSGAIGRKLAATFTSTGTAAYFLHAAEGLHGDLGIVHRGDVAICLSKSGNTDELSFFVPVFHKLQVPVIAITANMDSVLARNSDIVLNIGIREEACPHNLAPTSSTTAMLALGDALAIALLEKHNFSREDFAFLHPAGTLGKRLLFRVDDLMEVDHRVGKVSADAKMKQAVLEMAEKRGICVVLSPKEKIVGVITTGDLNRLLERTENFSEIPVTEVMNPEPKTVNSGTLAYTAYKMLEEYRIVALPVTNENRELVGIIHLHDLMQAGLAG